MVIGEQHTVEILSVNQFAYGVCRVQNMVVFVPGALQGEQCRIEIAKVYPKYAFARLLFLCTEAPERVVPVCPHAGTCGGCDFWHAAPAAEAGYKEQSVEALFEKRKLRAQVHPIYTPVDRRYRNKAVLFFDGQRFGFFQKGSKRVVPVSDCLCLPEVFVSVSDFTARWPWTTPPRALYLRMAADGALLVSPIFQKKQELASYATALAGAFPALSCVLCGVCRKPELVLESCSFSTVMGDGSLTDSFLGLSVRVSPKAFFQINRPCAEAVVLRALDLLALTPADTCADLFCGTGTIGLSAAARSGAQVIGVELEPSAVADAIYNAKQNGVQNIRFHCGDAADFQTPVTAAIVDPPRTGLSNLMIQTLLRLLPERVVYISCNPDTMARDVSLLEQAYRLASRVYPYNMFPRTCHTECVALLSRKQP